MSKQIGVTSGTVTIGGTDLEISSCSATYTQEEIEYTPCGSSGWQVQVPGGKRVVEGSCEAAWDSSIQGSGTYPLPFDDDLVSMVLNVGTNSLTFSAAVYNMAIEKSNEGLVSYNFDYKSSGTVTYA